MISIANGHVTAQAKVVGRSSSGIAGDRCFWKRVSNPSQSKAAFSSETGLRGTGHAGGRIRQEHQHSTREGANL